ncbi:MAG: hypothetical protein HY363_05855 [Candidatus Aenigmarchaeota archaeon]|nr:hypothetical protein [Candidatus Aenigmarchaeota archaeon]
MAIEDKTATWHVTLSYSNDNMTINEEVEKRARLYDGGDLVTRVLRYFKIPFSVRMMSDFYHDEPSLEYVKAKNEQGIESKVYEKRYFPVDGEYDVLKALEDFKVLPCNWKTVLREANNG